MKFEITETSLLNDYEETPLRIQQLQALNIKVMIDDFGKGYSSLSRLKYLHVDKLKIDRDFIVEADESDKSAGIYETIVELGKKLNIEVVAEGIETYEQVLFLKAFEPLLMQGYLFQKPTTKESQKTEAEIQGILGSFEERREESNLES